jgi:hypothetical protein
MTRFMYSRDRVYPDHDTIDYADGEDDKDANATE